MGNRTISFFKYGLGVVAATTLSTSAVAQTTQVTGDIWVDNWMAIYVDGTQVLEDSVSITTERSFNAESFAFNADLPAQVSIIAKDFIEDDSGLEYIGSRRQQMGDGGMIAQFYDAESGQLLAVSDNSWVCLAIHQAPLNANECERSANPIELCESNIQSEPEGWMQANFDDSSWPNAVIQSSQQVSPKGGYRAINWSPEAEFVWTSDLAVDNTILCRFTLEAQ